MTEGTDRTTDPEKEARTTDSEESNAQAEAVGTYETGEETVFYDTENPLAWIQTAGAVRLDDMV